MTTSKTTIVREWPSSSTQENVNIERYMIPGIMIWDVLRSYRSVVGMLQCTFCAEDHKTLSLGDTGYGVMGQEIVVMDPD